MLTIQAPPGVLGIWREWLFIFRDLGSTGNYFRGSGEQANSFRDLGSPAKKQKENKGKASILFDFFKKIFCFWGDTTPDPPVNFKCIYFRILCTSRLTSGGKGQLTLVVVDLLTLKWLIFTLVIAYFGTPRLHQIAPFFIKFSQGSMPPDPLARV